MQHSPLALDLQTPQLLFDAGLHLACLAQTARLAGSATYLRCRPLLLAEIARKPFGEMFLSDSLVTWLNSEQKLPENALILFDSKRRPADLLSTQYALRMMIGRDRVGGSPVMPYPMHPATLSNLKESTLIELRTRPRIFDLFFAGRQLPRYGATRIKQSFGVESRLTLLDVVRDCRDGRVVTSLDRNCERDAIVLLDSATCSIPSEKWLDTLAQADFFLCCPGGAQPMCHNVVEAMSVGAIPVVEYGDRFTPALTDGRNAICFHGSDGLRSALDRIDQLTIAQRAELRTEVIDFYDRYLRGDRFLAGLRDGKLGAPSGMISLPFDNRNHFQLEELPTQRRAA